MVSVWPKCFGSFTANGIVPLSRWLADNSQNVLERILCNSCVDLNVCISNIRETATPKFDSFVFVYHFCLFVWGLFSFSPRGKRDNCCDGLEMLSLKALFKVELPENPCFPGRFII